MGSARDQPSKGNIGTKRFPPAMHPVVGLHISRSMLVIGYRKNGRLSGITRKQREDLLARDSRRNGDVLGLACYPLSTVYVT